MLTTGFRHNVYIFQSIQHRLLKLTKLHYTISSTMLMHFVRLNNNYWNTSFRIIKTELQICFLSLFRYAIGNAERPTLKSKVGWLDILANDTHQFYYQNDTGGPSIKVSLSNDYLYQNLISVLILVFCFRVATSQLYILPSVV